MGMHGRVMVFKLVHDRVMMLIVSHSVIEILLFIVGDIP
jgi:hypothetical protein